MQSHFLQSKHFKAILSLFVMLLAFVSMTAFAAWSGPTSTSDNRAPFLNLGPVTQTKTGRLNITAGNQVLSSAKFEVAGPAMLAGGLNAAGNGSNTSALVLGDVYVGYVGSPSSAPTDNPAGSHAYDLYGDVTVSHDIKAQNLAHGNAGDLESVCTTEGGWLIPCTNLPSLPEVCGDPTATNFAGPYISNTVTFNNSLCSYATPQPVPAGCFIEGTMVKMADGQYKDIKDVQIGESLQTSGGAEVVMKKYAINYIGKLYKINNSPEYFVSDSHPFMTTEGWKSFSPEKTRLESPTLEVSQLGLGDVLIKENGETEVLKSFDFIKTNDTVYNFGLNGTRDFYADGYLVHNVDLFPITEAAPWVGSKTNFCDSYSIAQDIGTSMTYQQWYDYCNENTGSGSGSDIPACPAGTYPGSQAWSGDLYDGTCCPISSGNQTVDCAA